MILSDGDIMKSILNKEIGIHPFTKKQLQPSSYDLTVGDVFIIHSEKQISTKSPFVMEETVIEDDSIWITPGSFILGTTRETVKLGNKHCARIEGRSSIGRLGLAVHVTAGYIDAGFQGKITLELSNVTDIPIELEIGKRVCQIVFEELKNPCERPYGHKDLGSKYFGQNTTTQSFGFLDKD